MKPTESLCLLLLLAGTVARAEPVQWRPARPSASAGETPVVRLARPEPLQPATARSAPSGGERTVRPASFEVRQPLARAQAPVAPVPPPPVPGPGAIPGPNEDYNCGVDPGIQQPGFFGTIFGSITNPDGCRKMFQSDHEFPNFISPLTNPFYFEDPRALTEARPIVIWQDSPRATPFFAGGDIFFFGAQFRLALTERLSIVVHKVGGIHQDPNAPLAGVFEEGTGFTELHLGPKYTFIRNDTTRTLLAGGLIFELPIGSRHQLQNTGDLSLTPYVSFAQNFGRTSIGSFNFMTTAGYSLRVDNARTDFLFTSFHLDYDILELHTFYPLVELHWFSYTRSGKAQPINFEGADLYNFGARNVAGNNFLSLAVGGRYRMSDHFQMGLGVEFPISGRHDLMEVRITADMIFRY